VPRLRRTVVVSLAVPVLAAGAATAADAARAPAAGPAAPSVARPSHGRLVVKADEYRFGPAAIHAKAGRLRITLRNAGDVEHELVLLRTNRPAGALRTKGGRVSEAASVGEISETRPGAAASHTFDLKPGRYVMVCNLPRHYGQGMHGRLVVR
jgi:plastocyanin